MITSLSCTTKPSSVNLIPDLHPGFPVGLAVKLINIDIGLSAWTDLAQPVRAETQSKIRMPAQHSSPGFSGSDPPDLLDQLRGPAGHAQKESIIADAIAYSRSLLSLHGSHPYALKT